MQNNTQLTEQNTSSDITHQCLVIQYLHTKKEQNCLF